MEFRILGALEVCDHGKLLPIGTPRTRAVLGVLLTRPGEVVSIDRLTDELWPDEPPQAARSQVHDYLSRLRRALRGGSSGQAAAGRLVTRKPGYLIEVRGQELDRHRFEQLLAEARSAYRDDQLNRCLQLYREAHRLWRGQPFADVPPTPTINAAITTLTDLHLTSLEERYEAALTLEAGTDEDLVGNLTELAAANPLRERLAVQLMRALHRAGRTADALEAGRRAKQRLADELGIDPGPQLQETERAILRGELDTAAPIAASPVTSKVRPAQLPPDVSAFTGRAEQLADLDALLAATADQQTAVVISALSGTAGVGKTALAIHWAHQVIDRFPDGQLYVNLRGYDPDQPIESGEALTRFLSVLGVTGQEVPHNLDERAARYRSEVADRRMLIVLDNAGSVEQVRPLLPGSISSTVVVTSRDSLAGLVAVHGAHRLELDLLSPTEAVALLRRLIGPRVDAEPEAATTLAEQCARLPLALRVAAERAASRPTVPLAELVAELGDQRRRLDLLDGGGDPYATVRTVFSWSIHHLPPDTARMFRLLGLHPGVDIDPYAAAALAGADLSDARWTLAVLTRAHLLQPTGQDRYGMHDLLRAYAAELAHTQDTHLRRRAALSRLLDHYRHTASVAMDLAYPYERERRPRIPLTDTPTPDLSDPADAANWLDTELLNLLATARRAGEDGWPEHTLHLSAILHRHLRTRARYDDAEALHDHALNIARATGSRAGELDALNGLGLGYLLQGRYQEATDRYREALEIAHDTGHRAGEIAALRGLGSIHQVQDRYQQAIDNYREALEIARATGHATGELDVLIGLGDICRAQGRYQQAIDNYRDAREIARRTAHRAGELNALASLGDLHRLQGDLQQALDYLGQAWDIARAIGYRIGEVTTLVGLGTTYLRQGQPDQALGHYERALDIAREVNDRNWQFEALQGLGRVHGATGSSDVALAHHRQALELATDLGQPADQARAHDGLAHAHYALNRHEQARAHWQQALDILTRLGTDQTNEPEANTTTIRAHLAALPE